MTSKYIFVFLVFIAYGECKIIRDSHRLGIIGGHKISIEKVPYIASLRLNGTIHWCGSSIIHERFILTAAHCIVENRSYKILVGTDEVDKGGKLYDVEKIIIHEKYSNKTEDYDICIVKLNETLSFGKKVNKIALNENSVKLKRGLLLDTAGWGYTKFNGTISESLLSVKVKALNDSFRCTKCPAIHHRACIPTTEHAPGNDWLCSACKQDSAMSREDTFSTPIKTLSSVNNNLTVDAGVQKAGRIDLCQEIRLLREELSAMRLEVRQYREEITSFKITINQCLDRVANVESRVSVLEQELEEKTATSMEPFEETISELKNQLNDRDQELLLNDLLVAGVPEQKGENVHHIVKLIATKLGVELQANDVVHTERIGSLRRNIIESSGAANNLSADPTDRRPRAIAVRFACRSTRDNLLRAARVRRVLTTTDIEIASSQRRIYINERLTRTNYQLFARARDAGRRMHWRYIWSKDGKVFAKREEGTRTFRIFNDKDINKFFGN